MLLLQGLANEDNTYSYENVYFWFVEFKGASRRNCNQTPDYHILEFQRKCKENLCGS